MEPIEVLWIVLVLIFGAIGLIRGFLKELGVTTTVFVAIYIISQWLEGRGVTDMALGKAVGVSPGVFGALAADDPRSALIRCMLYILIMVFMVFISYHGETLTFGGSPPKGRTGVFFNLMIGLLNGYLVVGTIWYYLDYYKYPTQLIGLYQGDLSPLAQTLRSLLLFNVIPASFQEPVLVSFILFLIIMRVIK
ncbi:MAG: hypothetical protein H8E47_01005 [Anaerolineales bacterium]|nr:hypothetical protein [Anaerolineales bacterium]